MSTLSFAFTELVVGTWTPRVRMQAQKRIETDEHAYALEEVMMSLPDRRDAHILILTRYRSRTCPPAGSAWTGFLVTDINASLAAVKEAGGRIEVPVHENAEYRTRAAIAADPDGHLIEVIQMTTAE